VGWGHTVGLGPRTATRSARARRAPPTTLSRPSSATCRQVHTLPGPAPAGVVPRVPRSTLAFRERGDAAARARLGQGSSWAASRRALCGQEPSALGRLRAHRRGAGGLVTISRLWISLRSPGCRLVICGSTTPTATAHMGSTAHARCRRGAALRVAMASEGSMSRQMVSDAIRGQLAAWDAPARTSRGHLLARVDSHPGRVRVSGPVLTVRSRPGAGGPEVLAAVGLHAPHGDLPGVRAVSRRWPK